MKEQIETMGDKQMQTLIKVEKTQTGWAHWYKIGCLVIIEFVEGK